MEAVEEKIQLAGLIRIQFCLYRIIKEAVTWS